MDSKKLHKVRPSLGNPLILAPQDLKRFEITVAYRVDQEDKSEVTVPSTAIVEDVLRKNPPVLEWKSNGRSKKFNVKIYRVHSPFKHSYYWDNYGEVQHAETSAQQQYRNGFRWEMKVDIGITDDEITQLKDTFGWPSLLNLVGGPPNSLLHAIYVHETLKNSDEFTIFHITDTHIARRNDKIPELLCQVRNKKECEQIAGKYGNFNDNLRAFIKMANERWRSENGKVLVVLTGDIVDYYFDGWWDGKFICGQGEHAKYRADEEAKNKSDGSVWGYSNVGKFREIILGTDKKGEELLCPLFTVLGNHDYLMNEILLNFDISLGPFKLKSRDTSDAFNLSFDEGREYDYWAFPRNGGKHKSIRERKNFKENIDKNNWKASLNQDWSFWLAKPKSWQLGHYLCQINYDLDFKLNIGNHQVLCLNTGNDRYPRQEEFAGIEHQEDEDKDYIAGGPHNRGITSEHINLLDNAINSNQKGFIFVFTHAPLVGLHKDVTDDVDFIYEDTLEKTIPVPYNKVSQWLSRVFGIHGGVLSLMGFIIGGEKYFKHGDRDPFLNFSCSDGEVVPLLFKLSRKSETTTDRPVFVFSGHTHKVHEFRTELLTKPQGGSELGFFTDDYTKYLKHVLGSEWQKLLRALWLSTKSPLFFTSGALKSKKSTFREIVIKEYGVDHIEMKEAPNIEATANFSPGCRAIALRAHNGQYVCAEDGGGRELVANRDHIREWETFELCKLDSQQIALKAYNNQFVRAEGGGGGKVNADKSEIHSHELFKLHDLTGNKVALQTLDKGKYVCAEGGGGREIVANRDQIGSWETFELIELDRLEKPTQISPANGQVFDHYPRKTTLEWKAVLGATTYVIEIGYKSGNKWISYSPRSTNKTSYTFNFVGAQPGRWRVWAVGAGGQESPKTNWWEFRYTR